MDKETMQLVVVFLLMIAFVGIVLFLLMSLGLGKEGLAGASIWDILFKTVKTLGQFFLDSGADTAELVGDLIEY
ncbi:MAG: hypothetical protein GOV02_00995 [Candidatus Aenigmarchaeota archaeon]|nr:hypothetical protein [Candidatus Aenigmarchaeota archaeon]